MEYGSEICWSLLVQIWSNFILIDLFTLFFIGISLQFWLECWIVMCISLSLDQRIMSIYENIWWQWTKTMNSGHLFRYNQIFHQGFQCLRYRWGKIRRCQILQQIIQSVAGEGVSQTDQLRVKMLMACTDDIIRCFSNSPLEMQGYEINSSGFVVGYQGCHARLNLLAEHSKMKLCYSVATSPRADGESPQWSLRKETLGWQKLCISKWPEINPLKVRTYLLDIVGIYGKPTDSLINTGAL